MQERGSYKTRQKAGILACLKEADGRHMTAEDIASALRKDGEPASAATIYRNLEKLVADGEVIRYRLDANLPACYQYHRAGCGPQRHYHAVCSRCDEVFHLDSGEMDALGLRLESSLNFALDAHKTVLYGTCGRCRENEVIPL